MRFYIRVLVFGVEFCFDGNNNIFLLFFLFNIKLLCLYNKKGFYIDFGDGKGIIIIYILI